MEQAMENVAEGLDVAPPIEAPTVCEAFQRTAAQHADRVALRSKGGEQSWTWEELRDRVEQTARGLAGLGLGHGETMAILLPNVAECHIVDFAAAHLGAVPFTIFNTSTADQIAHQVENADARVIVTAEDFLPRVLEARDTLGDQVEHVISIDGDGGTARLDEVEAQGDPDFDVEAAWRMVGADDLATMIFTSGTTGPPKGAQWSHRTVMSEQRALDAVLPMASESIISFLPMAHAGGRITAHYMALPYGAAITACPDMKELPAYIADARPDSLFSVPRLWEKLQVGIEAMVSGIEDDSEREKAQRAIEVGIRRVKAGDAGEDASEDEADALAAEHEEALTALEPILAKLGLDRVKAAFVGGAPSAPELSQFWRAVGVPMLEAYGLTEGSLNIFNRVEDFKCGTAGKPLPGVEMRLGDDGELIVRAELNMVGYRKEPEKTAETIDEDGWLHTGDIAEVDDDGFVKIVDRKKEIIISASGKNMSPANIEQAIKGESSLIGQIVTIGDGQRYNTALITLDPEAAPVYAKKLGASGETPEELAESNEINAEIQRAVDAGNQRLSRVEQIKKFTLLPQVWQPDSDELTPTAKIKRKPIEEKYAAEIEALYAE